VALWQVGGGGVMHAMFGWCYGRACAQWAGVVGVVAIGLCAQQCCTGPATV